MPYPTINQPATMGIGTLILYLPPWAFFLFIMVLCLLSAEVGAYLAKRRTDKGIKDPDMPVGAAVGAILGLLAFMLGLNFSITMARFGDRKELVIEQANAIASCYLRAGFIPEKQKLESRKLLRDYTDILLEIPGLTGTNTMVTRIQAVHTGLWAQAISLKNEEMDSELRTFYVGTLNEVLNLSTQRATVGLIYRIPDILWTILLLLAVMGTFMLGFQTGNTGTRRITGIPMLAAAFAIVIVLIADMDDTRPNRFQVSQAPLKKVREMMNKNFP